MKGREWRKWEECGEVEGREWEECGEVKGRERRNVVRWRGGRGGRW